MSNKVFTYTTFISPSALSDKFYSTEEKCREALLTHAEEEANYSLMNIFELAGCSSKVEAFQSPIRPNVRGVVIQFLNPDGSEKSAHHSYIKDFEVL